MTPIANLGKSLKKIKSLTEQFIDDSAYDLGSAGELRNCYQKMRGARKRKRLKSAITRNINLAKRSAVELGHKGITNLIEAMECSSRQVVNHCNYFPKAEEWPGQEFVNRQSFYIEQAKGIIKALMAGK
jgi:hypothetical protein